MLCSGLLMLTCDPSNRLEDALEHIDEDLSALSSGLCCFSWGGLICRCCFQDLKERSLVSAVESHIGTSRPECVSVYFPAGRM